MKTIIYPYLSKNISNGWTATVPFCNRLNRSTVVEVTQYHEAGYIQAHIFIEITALSIGYFTPSMEGRFHLECCMEDRVFPDSLQFKEIIEADAGYPNLPIVKNMSASMQPYLDEKVIPESYIKSMIISEPPLISYHGSTTCNWIYNKYLTCLRSAILYTQFENPENFNLICLGDGSPINGVCPNHPGVSHGELVSFDADYFTHGASNATQYGPNPVDIWTSDDPSDMILNEAMVDWKKLYDFITGLAESAGEDYSYTTIHEKIGDLIQSNISTSAWLTFCLLVQFDIGVNYNHHNHMHVKFKRND